MVTLVAAVLTAALQWGNGFYSSDLGADPDEPAHAVTCLMVRDYLVSGLGQNPLLYAKEYYAQFPKVALGHYPPVFYLMGSLPLLVSRSIASLGVFQALLVGLLAGTSSLLLRPAVKPLVAYLLPIAWSVTPFMQKLTVLVVSDVLVALLCLLAAMAWMRFMETARLGWSLGFGCIATLAILTKGSAWSLALLPGLSIALSGRWPLLTHWRLWAAVLPVACAAVPWQLWSTKITARGMTGMTPLQHLSAALPFYGEALPRVLGGLLLLTVSVSFLWHLVRRVRGLPLPPMQAVLWALVLSTLVIVLAIPAGLTSRYLLPLFFPSAMLLALDLQTLLRGWPKQVAAYAVFTAATVVGAQSVIDKEIHGFASAVSQIRQCSTTDDDLRVLVVSDARGEGAVVSSAAFQEPAPRQRIAILRSSKELAEQDWMGRGLKLKTNGTAQLAELLAQKQVDWIIIDSTIPAELKFAHHDLVLDVLAQRTSGWSEIMALPVGRGAGQTGTLKIYRPAQPTLTTGPKP